MSNKRRIRVRDKDALRRSIAEYAAKGFTTVRDDGDSLTLSRKKPFNWVVAIILLFIPIIGWIALIAMIMAAGRRSEVIELSVISQAEIEAKAEAKVRAATALESPGVKENYKNIAYIALPDGQVKYQGPLGWKVFNNLDDLKVYMGIS